MLTGQVFAMLSSPHKGETGPQQVDTEHGRVKGPEPGGCAFSDS